MLMASLQGLPAFAAYFVLGYALVLMFAAIYSRITPHCEWTLMKQGNTSAAIAFGLSLVGYTLPVASAAINSVNLLDYLIWGVIALIAQLITFFTVRLYMPQLTQRITDNEMPAGFFLGACALATGILNAACMTW